MFHPGRPGVEAHTIGAWRCSRRWARNLSKLLLPVLFSTMLKKEITEQKRKTMNSHIFNLQFLPETRLLSSFQILGSQVRQGWNGLLTPGCTVESRVRAQYLKAWNNLNASLLCCMNGCLMERQVHPTYDLRPGILLLLETSSVYSVPGSLNFIGYYYCCCYYYLLLYY